MRQRFTIAHELGHRALHPGRELILDVPVRVNLRDKTSSMASDIEEIEANAFAATLLMPEQMIRDQLSQLPPARRREPDATADGTRQDLQSQHPSPELQAHQPRPDQLNAR